MNDLSFCKFHFPENINKVIWEITNQCNYSCEYCIFSSTGKKPRGELSFEKIIQTLAELKESGFNYIKFTGGEPFMREDFIHILKHAKNMGFNFDISTNASFITEDISQQLSLLDINFIHVSLDGYNLESHEFVRGKKSFNKTIIGLTHLLKYNKNIRLGCVIHRENDNYLDKIVALADELKVREIIFSMMLPIGRMNKNSPSISSKTPEELIGSINLIKTFYTKVNHNLQSDLKPISFKPFINNTPCPGGEQFLFIDSIGIVSPCTWISETFPQFHLLSLHNYSLLDILNHSLFKEFNYQKSLIKGECFAFAYKPPTYFNQIYSFATENLDFIYKLPLKNDTSALVITGSGDQALTLVDKGFKHITCIDINYLANYFTELKIAALKLFSYNQFVSFFKNGDSSLDYKLYKKLTHLLTPETEKFWNQKYIHFQYKGSNIRISDLFNLKYDSWEQKLLNVPYLQSESIFLNIQKNLQQCVFQFITHDISQYNFTQKFDLILLSNISDYSHKIFEYDYIKSFKTHYVEKLLPSIHHNGIFMFSYLYDFDNIGLSSIRNKLNIPLIRKMYFNEFNYKEIIIKSAMQEFESDVSCYIQT